MSESTAATAQASSAWGRRSLKPGFGFTEEQDLAFALGWPSYLTLTHDSDEDRDPAASAEALLRDDYPHLETRYPIETAARLTRVLCIPQTFDYESNPDEPQLTPAAREALAQAGPVDADEARSLLEKSLSAPHANTFVRGALLRLCEAFVGPDVVLAIAVAALERLPGTPAAEGRWYHEADALGSMLLRVAEGEHDAMAARLKGALEALPGAPHTCVVDGAAGNNAHNMPQHELDDPAFVLRCRQQQAGAFGDLPNPRLVFLGGEEVYAIELEQWRRYTFYPAGKAHRMIIERFAPIHSPYTVRLMLDMARRSKAKRIAKAWLRDHATFAAPTLEQLATEGDALAAKVLTR